ncbi:MAG: hypothetical protein DRR16_02460 [Candidatus Parabeggiatoa sp. nov. 3]|nr:MAG: hypothetical protein DRR00_06955 [Gammaproteobacteria bacterium]RKZ54441.1 MAG: hypothetical protein DRQ99_31215 [Gammaproteobacteria bacterium]RKZ89466.1 MAG: hypothetical protein DRR16_02460 [Gammaproteobacteria bacterium]
MFTDIGSHCSAATNTGLPSIINQEKFILLRPDFQTKFILRRSDFQTKFILRMPINRLLT